MGKINEKYLISENFQTKVYLTESFWENALLVAGFVPVIGEVADIILIIKFLKEKRYLEAGLMLIALIPTFGDFIVKPFLKLGKSARAFESVGKFTKFVSTDAKAAKMYNKVGTGFKNPLINKIIEQVRKILPGSAKEMETAKNLHINIWGKEVEKASKSGLGTWAKQVTRRTAREKYLIKTGGREPANFLSGWWNIVYKARRNRKSFIRRSILGSNVLASLGIFSLQDLERKMSNQDEAEQLLNNPKFKSWFDSVNNSQPTEDGQYNQQQYNQQQYNQQQDNQQQSGGGGDFFSTMLGLGGGSFGLEAIKKIAAVI